MHLLNEGMVLSTVMAVMVVLLIMMAVMVSLLIMMAVMFFCPY